MMETKDLMESITDIKPFQFIDIIYGFLIFILESIISMYLLGKIIPLIVYRYLALRYVWMILWQQWSITHTHLVLGVLHTRAEIL